MKENVMLKLILKFKKGTLHSVMTERPSRSFLKRTRAGVAEKSPWPIKSSMPFAVRSYRARQKRTPCSAIYVRTVRISGYLADYAVLESRCQVKRQSVARQSKKVVTTRWENRPYRHITTSSINTILTRDIRPIRQTERQRTTVVFVSVTGRQKSGWILSIFISVQSHKNNSSKYLQFKKL